MTFKIVTYNPNWPIETILECAAVQHINWMNRPHLTKEKQYVRPGLLPALSLVNSYLPPENQLECSTFLWDYCSFTFLLSALFIWAYNDRPLPRKRFILQRSTRFVSSCNIDENVFPRLCGYSCGMRHIIKENTFSLLLY